MTADTKEKQLPNGWAWTSLDSLGEGENAIVDGPFGSNLKKSDYIDDNVNGIPVLTTKNLEGDYSDNNVRFISKNKYEELKRSKVIGGDILVAKIGSIGKTGIYPREARTAIIPANLLKFTVTSNVLLKYVYAYLNYGGFQRLIKKISTATAQPAFNVTKFRKLPIPLPPFPEQQRIVDKIEELFSDLDNGVENLKLLQDKLKVYRQAVLKYAFEGKLTAEWRKKNKNKIESASILLEQIAKEQGAIGANVNKLSLLDETELPELPDTWKWTILDNIADIKGGITKDQKKKYDDGREIAYLRVANVQRGYLDLSEISKIEASEDIIQSLLLRKGDILFTEGGDRDKLGRGCVWNNELPECIHQNHIFRARLFSDQIESKLISWHGNTFGQGYFMKQGKQTTNLASINMTKLRNFPVPIIPFLEQKEIILTVDRLFSIVDEVRQTIEKSLNEAETLRQSILKKAFEGKLVPQDPNDEPAEKLLERIKAEKQKYIEIKKAKKVTNSRNLSHKRPKKQIKIANQ